MERTLTAKAILTDLLPSLNDQTLDLILLWPPNLFAYTSSFLSITGAYNYAVSPQSTNENNKENIWPVSETQYKQLITHGEERLKHTHGQDYLNSKLRISPVTNCYECITEKQINKNNTLSVPAERCIDGCKLATAHNNLPADNDYHEYSWHGKVQKIGRFWRSSLTNFNTDNLLAINNVHSTTIQDSLKLIPEYVPSDVLYLWYNLKQWICDSQNHYIVDVMKNISSKSNSSLIQVILTLHAIADETCAGWGISTIDEIGRISKAQEHAHELLDKGGTLATIDISRARILPKRHTPNVGITLRSFSSHLGYHKSSIDVNWIRENVNPLSEQIEEHKSFTVMLMPWPLQVRTQDFKKVKIDSINVNQNDYGFFAYDPDSRSNLTRQRPDVIKQLEQYILNAQLEAGSVDMVVFPESSLNVEEVDTLEKILTKHNISLYVCGVRDNNASNKDTNSGKMKNNVVYFNSLSKDNQSAQSNKTKRYEFKKDNSDNNKFMQNKHHRWKLTRPQIVQYGLGRVLKPNINWWEAINIPQRRVTFINVGKYLTLCPLICEDLARQDPIADLIRTVGPSLVITILMDGPQKIDRWSSRYASVLADDPGSSVITLTSFGMVERWNHSAREKSKIVSLWNDGRGPAREIPLEDGAVGILLSLCVEDKYEKVADGRTEKYKTSIVTLGGVHQIYDKK